jgi:hypothetical protein
MDSCGSGQGPKGSFCERCNETSQGEDTQITFMEGSAQSSQKAAPLPRFGGAGPMDIRVFGHV